MAITIRNVANRLPVTVAEKITKSSGGLVAALEGVTGGDYQLRWIGWPGGAIPEERQPEVEQTFARDHAASAVFLTKAEAAGFYEGFSNSSLWPLLHSMPSRFRFQAAWWPVYHEVNRRFADKVLAEAEEGDLIWVHDYQLMLVPGMLREAIVNRTAPPFRIGFFLHTPFPSYDLFRYHPRRAELLEGMLGADLIGFHTFHYLRQFNDAIVRAVGEEPEVMHVVRPHHVAHLGVYPIGINARRFEEELAKPEHAAAVAGLEKTYAGQRLIVSVERLDYTKGIIERIEAVDSFLARSDATEREQIKFVFVSVPSREGVEEYRELRKNVETRVGRINGKYATLHNSPVHFVHGSIEFPQLAALYARADVGMVTPLIDGMNLVAKEYVACQPADRPGGPGVLILSEFAGAAEELSTALVVNPFDIESVVRSLRRALAMPAAERASRMAPMRRRVMSYDAPRWAQSFIDDLRTADETPPPRPTQRAAEAIAPLRAAARAGEKVALFLDYDGTLREIEEDPAAAFPNAAVRETLDRLLARPNFAVAVVSGRTAEDLGQWFTEPRLSLVAEHGAALRRAGRTEWERVVTDLPATWREEVLRLLRVYEASTPGSFVEEKRAGLVWHYRRSDVEFGRWKAVRLVGDLSQLTANLPLDVRHGRKIVEIALSNVSKGAAVSRLVGEVQPAATLCAGDDTTDESMFRLTLPGLVTIKVGRGTTKAQSVITSPAQFRDLLKELSSA